MEWLLFIALGGFGGAAVGYLMAASVGRKLPKRWHRLLILAVSLLVGYAALHLGVALAEYLVSTEPENAKAEGPLVFVAVMSVAMSFAVPALVASGVAALVAVRRLKSG
jgi:ABC-type uncharacterized transport system permease subunit